MNFNNNFNINFNNNNNSRNIDRDNSSNNSNNNSNNTRKNVHKYNNQSNQLFHAHPNNQSTFNYINDMTNKLPIIDNALGTDNDVKLAIELTIIELLNSSKLEASFPSSFTSQERRFVHKYAADYHLGSITQTKHGEKIVYVFKNQSSLAQKFNASLPVITSKSVSLIKNFLATNSLDRYRDQDHNTFPSHSIQNQCITGKLSYIIPQIPPASKPNTQTQHVQMQLPIHKFQSVIIDTISKYQVVVVTGDPGCGKSTQIPQFILNHCHVSKQTCCLISSQPNRVDALGLADHIAYERGEQLGQTVGFQIRLESKMSPRTLLTVCTNSVLLRTLIANQNVIDSVSHIILDQLECRDCNSELLLLHFRQLLSKSCSHVKLILLTNAWFASRLSIYFDNCPIINIINYNQHITIGNVNHVAGDNRLTADKSESKCSDLYLDNVLQLTNHLRPIVQHAFTPEMLQALDKQKQTLALWLQYLNIDINCLNVPIMNRQHQLYASLMRNNQQMNNELDTLLSKCWFENIDIYATQYIQKAYQCSTSLDYVHSETGLNLLIVAICRRQFNLVKHLLKAGVDLRTRTVNDMDALGWSQHLNYAEISLIILTYMKFDHLEVRPPLYQLFATQPNTHYFIYRQLKTVTFDYDLIINLLLSINQQLSQLNRSASSVNHTILIYVPEYEQLVRLRRILIERIKYLFNTKLMLLSVHSNMSLADRKRLYQTNSSDQLKIVLIAAQDQTHITLSDVSYIIDCTLSVNTIKSQSQIQMWLLHQYFHASQLINHQSTMDVSNSLRLPVRFHLYAYDQINMAHALPAPVIQSHLSEKLCLSAISICEQDCETYLLQALDAPSPAVIQECMQRLRIIQAIDSNQRLTEFGFHMLDLPINPCLGKSVLAATVLKCLDPVLTICCILAIDRWPFEINLDHHHKRLLRNNRNAMVDKTFSEHLLLLRAFQQWQRARSDNNEQAFIDKTGLKLSSMQQAVGLRAQVLGQLRASGFIKTRGAGDIKDLNNYSQHWPVVKAALCIGNSFDIVRYDRCQYQFVSGDNKQVNFRPGSLFEQLTVEQYFRQNEPPSEWLIVGQTYQSQVGNFVECCTMITPTTLALFASFNEDNWMQSNQSSHKQAPQSQAQAQLPNHRHLQITSNMDNLLGAFAAISIDNQCGRFDDSDSENETIKMGETTWTLLCGHKLCLPKMNEDLLMRLRFKWQNLLRKKMASPGRLLSISDDSLVKTIVTLLNEEEKSNQLPQLIGIGDRPIQFSTDFCSSHFYEPNNSNQKVNF